jgi:glycosyltransferase involved in cell wall biosynthesis
MWFGFMDRKKLLLLTHGFPFGRGEEFLETEIEYLAAEFDVTIVPCLPNIISTAQRQVPASVEVRNDVSKLLSKNRKELFLWLLKNLEFWVGNAGKLLNYLFAYRNLRVTKGLLVFLVRMSQIENGLCAFLEGQSFSIVYSYWLSAAAGAAAGLKKSKLVAHAVARTHGHDLYHERSALKILPGQATVVAGLDRIFCISEHGYNYLCKHYPNQKSKFVVSRLGVNPAPSSNPFTEKDFLHIVSCSYLSPVKRVNLIIEALKQICFPLKWTHLGGGILEDELKSMAKNLPANVSWQISGNLKNQEILSFYQEIPVDLFLNVSSSEGLPVSIMEAMSYGIPVAATNVGGTSELVQSNLTGFLWPEDVSPGNIAETLRDFQESSPIKKKQMRERALQAWYDKVNAEIQYPDFINQLKMLTEQ